MEREGQSADELRARLQALQKDAVSQLDDRLRRLVNEAVRAVETPRGVQEVRKEDTSPTKDGSLREKVFKPQDSILTDLFKIKHVRTIYNIFITMLISLLIHTAVYDLVADGKLKLGFSTIFWNWSGLHFVVITWLAMFAATLGLYTTFIYWAAVRTAASPKGSGRRLLDVCALLSLAAYYVLFFTLPVLVIQNNKLPPVSAFVILAEQVRMIMKSHAFVRSNVPKVTKYKPHSDDKMLLPDFNYYIFFLFVPTLVYRDSYPRTQSVRWRVVAWHLSEVVGVMFFISFVFERSLVPVFKEFGLRPVEPEAMVVAVFGSMVPATLVFLSGFYCLLHAWLNAFAEITRFADRMFYKDWWNANSYAAYFRMWNVVVHDWLYTYVYKDTFEALGSRNRLLPLLLVFLLSAVVHEYMLAFTFGFFYPMLFIAFGVFSVGLVFITHDRLQGGNIMMWLFVSSGCGILTCLYMTEWFARQNCPRLVESFWDFFVPRSWFCTTLSSTK